MNAAPFVNGFAEVPSVPLGRTIPFDYAFRYTLTGVRDNVINQTVTVSIEATFVAVSIGYGVISKFEPVKFGIPPLPPVPPILLIRRAGPPKDLGSIPLGELLDDLGRVSTEDPTVFRERIGPRAAAALRAGIKLNPDFIQRVLLLGKNQPVEAKILEELFQVVAPPPEEIQFLYALFDEGTGREFQSEPILNIAGLGISNGDRPFRYFAKPITFAPRSTIRLQVTEISEFQGDLHVSLQGYKMLGEPGTPTGRVQTGRRSARRR